MAIIDHGKGNEKYHDQPCMCLPVHRPRQVRGTSQTLVLAGFYHIFRPNTIFRLSRMILPWTNISQLSSLECIYYHRFLWLIWALASCLFLRLIYYTDVVSALSSSWNNMSSDRTPPLTEEEPCTSSSLSDNSTFLDSSSDSHPRLERQNSGMW